MEPELAFASPRKLPRASSLRGRVVVLDIAFAADGLGKGFRKVTGKFIEQLGDRLVRWVDHHDHERHAEFASDPRFVLHTKAEHGACPEIITPEMVRESGPVDTILAHFDLDGLYAAAKWALGGVEPYPGADDDARAVDTRIGEPSARALLIDKALRVHYADPVLKVRIVRWLTRGLKPGLELDSIKEAAADFDRQAEGARALAERFEVAGGIAFVDIPPGAPPFDKTELLLLGQRRATVAVVADGVNVSIAASFDSGLNFVQLLELGGGMPTRVSVPRKRLALALARIRERLARGE
ncbi:MAG: hypothetical protein H6713_21820 [Myxococcales bacterium]|nr:hypothetical protein [Myxococcales bacterium]MCB9752601.1 hypothetical protein [Myxococcales bacterium]